MRHGAGPRLAWALLAAAFGIGLGAFAYWQHTLHPQIALLLFLLVVTPFGVLVAGGLKRYLLAIIVLDIPFQIDVFLGRDPGQDLFALQGYIVSATTISGLVLYVIWMMEALAGRQRTTTTGFRSAVTAALAAYLGSIIISVFVAADRQLSTYELFLQIQLFLVFLYIAAHVTSRQDVLFVVRVLLAAVVLESLVMLMARLVGSTIGVAGIESVIMDGRVAGTVGSFNRAASFLNLGLAIGLATLFACSGRMDRLLAGLATALGSLALIFTLSRGGWMGFLCAVTLLLAIAWNRGRVSSWVPVLAITFLLSLFFAFQEPIVARLEGQNASDPEARIALMRMASRVIADHPILGVGANNYGAVLDEYVTPEFNGTWVHQVHNKYLLVWAETGVLGLITFMVFLTSVVRVSFRAWRTNAGQLGFVALGIAAGVAAYMVQMPTERFVSRPQLQLLWVAAALAVAIDRLIRSSGTDESSAGSAGGSLVRE